MTLALFYVDHSELRPVGGTVELAGDEGNHAVRVKRVRVGEQLLIGDGNGRVVCAEVSEIVGKERLRAQVLEVVDHVKPSTEITVIQGLIKGERMDRCLETLTESGVDRICLWSAARSIAKLDPARGVGKFETKVIQASKQARRAYVPQLEAITDLEATVRRSNGLVLVLDEEANEPLSTLLPAGSEVAQVMIIVGPEGGIDDTEREKLRAAGGQLASMGPVILRASTAGTVAAGWVMGATERWRECNTYPMSDCLFCAIAAGDIPATIVKRTDSVVVFADINAQAPVHVLAIPVAHYDTIADLVQADPQLTADLLAVATQAADELGLDEGYRLVFNTGKNGGQTVGHVHAHVLGGRHGLAARMTSTHIDTTITLPSSISMVNLLGVSDDVLRAIEAGLPEVSFTVRGNQITLSGPESGVLLAQQLIDELLMVLRSGHAIAPDSIERSLSLLRTNNEVTPSQLLTAGILSNRGRSIRPKTLGQKQYVDAIDKNTVVFGIGPAGTGKTYLAVAKAVQALQNKSINRIILTRPAVEAGERLGFLPGTLSEKIDPYLRPLYDALHDMIDPDSIPRLMTSGTIEVAPLAYMRGRTLNDAFVILDEAQNTTPEQMKMFLTRLGFGTTVVVTGDVTQVDLPGGTRSGLRVVRDILRGIDDVAFCELTSRDVVRHPLVGRIVDAYGRYDEEHNRRDR